VAPELREPGHQGLPRAKEEEEARPRRRRRRLQIRIIIVVAVDSDPVRRRAKRRNRRLRVLRGADGGGVLPGVDAGGGRGRRGRANFAVPEARPGLGSQAVAPPPRRVQRPRLRRRRRLFKNRPLLPARGRRGLHEAGVGTQPDTGPPQRRPHRRLVLRTPTPGRRRRRTLHLGGPHRPKAPLPPELGRQLGRQKYRLPFHTHGRQASQRLPPGRTPPRRRRR